MTAISRSTWVRVEPSRTWAPASITFWAKPGLCMSTLKGPRTPCSTSTMASNSSCCSFGISALSEIILILGMA